MGESFAILFPHTFVAEKELDRVLALFDQVDICQAWGMDPIPVSEARRDRVRFLHPSDELRPEGDIKALVARYTDWMRQHPGRGYEALFSQNAAEESTWEIRGELRGSPDAAREPRENPSLKWHILLHLARESEQNQSVAHELLTSLKQGPSPLLGALEEDAPTDPFLEDIPQADESPYMTDQRLGQILDAWLGLFTDRIPKEAVLATLQRHVFEYMSIRAEREIPIPWGMQTERTREELPRIVFGPHGGHDPLLAAVSGKALVWINGPA